MAPLGGDLPGGNTTKGFSAIPGHPALPEPSLPCLGYSNLGVAAKYLLGNPCRTGREG